MIDAIIEVNQRFSWFFPVFVFTLGACIGSFLNVVIYRMPAGKSVVRPGSHCSCGTPIAWYDNIPIFSWILRRGRARCCGARFSIRYPLVEALTGGLFLAAWLNHSLLPGLVILFFIAWLIAPSFIDLDTMEIPDLFSIGGFVLGLFLSMLVPSLHGFGGDFFAADALRGLIASLLGAFVGSGLILWVALVAETLLRKEAMGFGDVKLMGAIGAFCGWQGAVFALFGGAVLGCIGFGLALVFGYRGPKPEEPDPDAEASDKKNQEESGVRIPFGPALAGAAILYLIWLQPWIDGYFAMIEDVFFP